MVGDLRGEVSSLRLFCSGKFVQFGGVFCGWSELLGEW